MKRKTLLWILTGVMIVCALVFIPSFASLLFLVAAFLVAPIQAVKDLLDRWRLKGWISGVLAAVIFLVGCFTAPLDNSKAEVGTSMERAIVATAEPTAEPSEKPTPTPTATPSPAPEEAPTPEPTTEPTPAPTPEPTQTPEVQHTYVINTNTGKFHIPSCSSVGDIKPGNRQDYTGTRDSVIAMGYEPCGRCHP